MGWGWTVRLGVFFLVAGCAKPPGAQEGLLIIKASRGANALTALQEGLKAQALDGEIDTIARAFPESGAIGQFAYERYFTLSLKKRARAEAILETLQSAGGIEYVEPAYLLTDPFDYTAPTDPKLPRQWYLDKLGIKKAWEKARGAGVRIADVESGFDISHPDLKEQVDAERSRDYDPDTDDTAKVNDNKRSHGTSVLGVLAARANDAFGVGVAFESTLIASQMANSAETHASEKAWTVITADAVLGSVERGAHVVLVEKQIPSLAASVEASRVISDAITAAVKAGAVVVVPAGNFAEELTTEEKAPDTGSIVVGAITKEGKKTLASNFGKRVNVCAYGEALYTLAENKGETETFGGTSGAAALVAGIAGLVRSAKPGIDPKAVRKVLIETGTPIEGDKSVGTLVQAGDAVIRALELE